MTSQSSIDSVPTVAVLLATHQPKSYIEEQIQSIQAQNGVKTKIYWGDHASSDFEISAPKVFATLLWVQSVLLF